MQEVKEQLSQVRGRIVEMPLNFLARERLIEVGANVNPVTLAIFM
jgi:phospholipase D1/2